MRSRSNWLFRGLAAGFAFCFLADTVVHATGAPALDFSTLHSSRPTSVQSLIPASIAEVRGVHEFGGTKPFVYLIEDAHANPSSQINAAKVLKTLFQNRKGLEWVFLEGGSGDLSLSALRADGSLEARHRAAERLVRKGRLQGAEYFDLVTDREVRLWGADDEALYRESVGVYAELLAGRGELLGSLMVLRESLTVLTEKRVSPPLQTFLSKRRMFREDRIDPAVYAQWVGAELDRLGEKKPEELERVLKTLAMEKAIDWDRLQKEWVDASGAEAGGPANGLSESAPALSRQEMELDYLERRDAVQGAAPASERRKRWPELEKYSEYFESASQCRSERLLENLVLGERTIAERLSRDAAEKGFVAADEAAEFLRRAVLLRLTPGDRAARPARDLRLDEPDRLMGFINRQILESREFYDRAVLSDPVLQEAMRQVERFYILAEARDRSMVNNALSKLNESGSREAVLVVGGFHAPGICRVLDALRVPHAVIRPNVLESTDAALYERLLLAGTPHEVRRLAASGRENPRGLQLPPVRTGRAELGYEALRQEIASEQSRVAGVRGHSLESGVEPGRFRRAAGLAASWRDSFKQIWRKAGSRLSGVPVDDDAEPGRPDWIPDYPGGITPEVSGLDGKKIEAMRQGLLMGWVAVFDANGDRMIAEQIEDSRTRAGRNWTRHGFDSGQTVVVSAPLSQRAFRFAGRDWFTLSSYRGQIVTAYFEVGFDGRLNLVDARLGGRPKDESDIPDGVAYEWGADGRVRAWHGNLSRQALWSAPVGTVYGVVKKLSGRGGEFRWAGERDSPGWFFADAHRGRTLTARIEVQRRGEESPEPVMTEARLWADDENRRITRESQELDGSARILDSDGRSLRWFAPQHNAIGRTSPGQTIELIKKLDGDGILNYGGQGRRFWTRSAPEFRWFTVRLRLAHAANGFYRVTAVERVVDGREGAASLPGDEGQEALRAAVESRIGPALFAYDGRFIPVIAGQDGDSPARQADPGSRLSGDEKRMERRLAYWNEMRKIVHPGPETALAFYPHAGADLMAPLHAVNPDVLIMTDRFRFGNPHDRANTKEAALIRKSIFSEPMMHETFLDVMFRPGVADVADFLRESLSVLGVREEAVRWNDEGGGVWRLDFDWRHPSEGAPRPRTVYYLGGIQIESLTARNLPPTVLDVIRANGGVDVFVEKAPNYYKGFVDAEIPVSLSQGINNDQEWAREIRAVNALRKAFVKKDGWIIGDNEQLWGFSSNDYPPSATWLQEEAADFVRARKSWRLMFMEWRTREWGNGEMQLFRRKRAGPPLEEARPGTRGSRLAGGLSDADYEVLKRVTTNRVLLGNILEWIEVLGLRPGDEVTVVGAGADMVFALVAATRGMRVEIPDLEEGESVRLIESDKFKSVAGQIQSAGGSFEAHRPLDYRRFASEPQSKSLIVFPKVLDDHHVSAAARNAMLLKAFDELKDGGVLAASFFVSPEQRVADIQAAATESGVTLSVIDNLPNIDFFDGPHPPVAFRVSKNPASRLADGRLLPASRLDRDYEVFDVGFTRFGLNVYNEPLAKFDLRPADFDDDVFDGRVYRHRVTGAVYLRYSDSQRVSAQKNFEIYTRHAATLGNLVPVLGFDSPEGPVYLTRLAADLSDANYLAAPTRVEDALISMIYLGDYDHSWIPSEAHLTGRNNVEIRLIGGVRRLMLYDFDKAEFERGISGPLDRDRELFLRSRFSDIPADLDYLRGRAASLDASPAQREWIQNAIDRIYAGRPAALDIRSGVKGARLAVAETRQDPEPFIRRALEKRSLNLWKRELRRSVASELDHFLSRTVLDRIILDRPDLAEAMWQLNERLLAQTNAERWQPLTQGVGLSYRRNERAAAPNAFYAGDGGRRVFFHYSMMGHQDVAFTIGDQDQFDAMDVNDSIQKILTDTRSGSFVSRTLRRVVGRRVASDEILWPVTAAKIQEGRFGAVYLVLIPLKGRERAVIPFILMFAKKGGDTSLAVFREYRNLRRHQNKARLARVLEMGRVTVERRRGAARRSEKAFFYSSRFLNHHGEILFPMMSNPADPKLFLNSSLVPRRIYFEREQSRRMLAGMIARFVTFYNETDRVMPDRFSIAAGDINLDERSAKESAAAYPVSERPAAPRFTMIAWRGNRKGVDPVRFLHYLFELSYLDPRLNLYAVRELATGAFVYEMEDHPIPDWISDAVLEGFALGLVEKHGRERGLAKAKLWLNRFLEEAGRNPALRTRQVLFESAEEFSRSQVGPERELFPAEKIRRFIRDNIDRGLLFHREPDGSRLSLGIDGDLSKPDMLGLIERRLDRDGEVVRWQGKTLGTISALVKPDYFFSRVPGAKRKTRFVVFPEAEWLRENRQKLRLDYLVSPKNGARYFEQQLNSPVKPPEGSFGHVRVDAIHGNFLDATSLGSQKLRVLVIDEIQTRIGYGDLDRDPRPQIDLWRDAAVRKIEEAAAAEGFLLFAKAYHGAALLDGHQFKRNYLDPYAARDEKGNQRLGWDAEVRFVPSSPDGFYRDDRFGPAGEVMLRASPRTAEILGLTGGRLARRDGSGAESGDRRVASALLRPTTPSRLAIAEDPRLIARRGELISGLAELAAELSGYEQAAQTVKAYAMYRWMAALQDYRRVIEKITQDLRTRSKYGEFIKINEWLSIRSSQARTAKNLIQISEAQSEGDPATGLIREQHERIRRASGSLMGGAIDVLDREIQTRLGDGANPEAVNSRATSLRMDLLRKFEGRTGRLSWLYGHDLVRAEAHLREDMVTRGRGMSDVFWLKIYPHWPEEERDLYEPVMRDFRTSRLADGQIGSLVLRIAFIDGEISLLIEQVQHNKGFKNLWEAHPDVARRYDLMWIMSAMEYAAAAAREVGINKTYFVSAKGMMERSLQDVGMATKLAGIERHISYEVPAQILGSRKAAWIADETGVQVQEVSEFPQASVRSIGAFEGFGPKLEGFELEKKIINNSRYLEVTLRFSGPVDHHRLQVMLHHQNRKGDRRWFDRQSTWIRSESGAETFRIKIPNHFDRGTVSVTDSPFHFTAHDPRRNLLGRGWLNNPGQDFTAEDLTRLPAERKIFIPYGGSVNPAGLMVGFERQGGRLPGLIRHKAAALRRWAVSAWRSASRLAGGNELTAPTAATRLERALDEAGDALIRRGMSFSEWRGARLVFEASQSKQDQPALSFAWKKSATDQPQAAELIHLMADRIERQLDSGSSVRFRAVIVGLGLRADEFEEFKDLFAEAVRRVARRKPFVPVRPVLEVLALERNPKLIEKHKRQVESEETVVSRVSGQPLFDYRGFLRRANVLEPDDLPDFGGGADLILARNLTSPTHLSDPAKNSRIVLKADYAPKLISDWLIPMNLVERYGMPGQTYFVIEPMHSIDLDRYHADPRAAFEHPMIQWPRGFGRNSPGEVGIYEVKTDALTAGARSFERYLADLLRSGEWMESQPRTHFGHLPQRHDTRAYDAGLTAMPYIAYDEAVRSVVNPEYRPLRALYGASGLDVVHYLKSLDAADGVFVSRFDGLTLDSLREVRRIMGEGRDSFLERRLPGLVTYKNYKYEFGHANHTHIDGHKRMINALAYELFAAGVDQIEVEGTAEAPAIRFEWSYDLGVARREYRIRFVDADISQPETWPEYLKQFVSAGFDVYYQRASMTLPAEYPKAGRSYIHEIHDHLREGGYMVTNDYAAYSYDPDHEGAFYARVFHDFGPDFPIGRAESAAVDIPRENDLIFGILRVRKNYSMQAVNYYGWRMRVRRKKSASGAAARLAAAEPSIPEIDLGQKLTEWLARRIWSAAGKKGNDPSGEMRDWGHARWILRRGWQIFFHPEAAGREIGYAIFRAKGLGDGDMQSEAEFRADERRAQKIVDHAARYVNRQIEREVGRARKIARSAEGSILAHSLDPEGLDGQREVLERLGVRYQHLQDGKTLHGGDWFRVSADGPWTLIEIADGVGNGVDATPAWLLQKFINDHEESAGTPLIRSVARAGTAEKIAPVLTAYVNDLNARVADYSDAEVDRNFTVTFTYGLALIDRTTGAVYEFSAGHPRMIGHYRGGKWKPIENRDGRSSFMLGMFRENDYSAEIAAAMRSYPPMDLVLMQTDGVTDYYREAFPAGQRIKDQTFDAVVAKMFQSRYYDSASVLWGEFTEFLSGLTDRVSKKKSTDITWVAMNLGPEPDKPHEGSRLAATDRAYRKNEMEALSAALAATGMSVAPEEIAAALTRGLTLEEVAAWRPALGRLTQMPERFFGNGETLRSWVIAVLDDLDGFKTAREAGNWREASRIYREKVLGYPESKEIKGSPQTKFFDQRMRIRQNLFHKDYMDYLDSGEATKSNALKLIRFVLPQLLGEYPLILESEIVSGEPDWRKFLAPGRLQKAFEQNDAEAQSALLRDHGTAETAFEVTPVSRLAREFPRVVFFEAGSGKSVFLYHPEKEPEPLKFWFEKKGDIFWAVVAEAKSGIFLYRAKYDSGDSRFVFGREYQMRWLEDAPGYPLLDDPILIERQEDNSAHNYFFGSVGARMINLPRGAQARFEGIATDPELSVIVVRAGVEGDRKVLYGYLDPSETRQSRAFAKWTWSPLGQDFRVDYFLPYASGSWFDAVVRSTLPKSQGRYYRKVVLNSHGEGVLHGAFKIRVGDLYRGRPSGIPPEIVVTNAAEKGRLDVYESDPAASAKGPWQKFTKRKYITSRFFYKKRDLLIRPWQELTRRFGYWRRNFLIADPPNGLVMRLPVYGRVTMIKPAGESIEFESAAHANRWIWVEPIRVEIASEAYPGLQVILLDEDRRPVASLRSGYWDGKAWIWTSPTAEEKLDAASRELILKRMVKLNYAEARTSKASKIKSSAEGPRLAEAEALRFDEAIAQVALELTEQWESGRLESEITEELIRDLALRRIGGLSDPSLASAVLAERKRYNRRIHQIVSGLVYGYRVREAQRAVDAVEARAGAAVGAVLPHAVVTKIETLIGSARDYALENELESLPIGQMMKRMDHLSGRVVMDEDVAESGGVAEVLESDEAGQGDEAEDGSRLAISLQEAFGSSSPDAMRFVLGSRYDAETAASTQVRRVDQKVSERDYADETVYRITETYEFGTPQGGAFMLTYFEGSEKGRLLAREALAREIVLSNLAHDEGIAPEVLMIEMPTPQMVTRFIGGKPADQLKFDAERIKSLGRAIGRLHAREIVHGDLTVPGFPQIRYGNILVIEGPGGSEVQFVDFEYAGIETDRNDLRRKEFDRLLAALQHQKSEDLDLGRVNSSFEEGYRAGLEGARLAKAADAQARAFEAHQAFLRGDIPDYDKVVVLLDDFSRELRSGASAARFDELMEEARRKYPSDPVGLWVMAYPALRRIADAAGSDPEPAERVLSERLLILRSELGRNQRWNKRLLLEAVFRAATQAQPRLSLAPNMKTMRSQNDPDRPDAPGSKLYQAYNTVLQDRGKNPERIFVNWVTALEEAGLPADEYYEKKARTTSGEATLKDVELYANPIEDEDRLASRGELVSRSRSVNLTALQKLKTSRPDLVRAAVRGMAIKPHRKSLFVSFNGADFRIAVPAENFDPTATVVTGILNLSGETPVLESVYDEQNRKVYPTAEQRFAYFAPSVAEARAARVEANGAIADLPLHKAISFLRDPVWRAAEQSGAGAVILTNIEVYGHGESNGTTIAAFTVDNRDYHTQEPFDPDSPWKVWVILDPRTRTVQAAYRQIQAEAEAAGPVQVYPHDGQMRMYLDPPLENHRPAPDAPLYLAQGSFVADALARDPRIGSARNIVLTNIRTRSKQGEAAEISEDRPNPTGFTWLDDFFVVDRNFKLQGQTRLVVHIDRASMRPQAAYEYGSGREVYPFGSQRRIFLNFAFDQGQFAPGPLYAAYKHIPNSFWGRKALKNKRKIAISDVALFRVPTKAAAPDPDRPLRLVWYGRGGKAGLYPIAAEYRPKDNSRIIAVVDPKSLAVREIWDGPNRTRIYPDYREYRDRAQAESTVTSESEEIAASKPKSVAIESILNGKAEGIEDVTDQVRMIQSRFDAGGNPFNGSQSPQLVARILKILKDYYLHYFESAGRIGEAELDEMIAEVRSYAQTDPVLTWELVFPRVERAIDTSRTSVIPAVFKEGTGRVYVLRGDWSRDDFARFQQNLRRSIEAPSGARLAAGISADAAAGFARAVFVARSRSWTAGPDRLRRVPILDGGRLRYLEFKRVHGAWSVFFEGEVWALESGPSARIQERRDRATSVAMDRDKAREFMERNQLRSAEASGRTAFLTPVVFALYLDGLVGEGPLWEERLRYLAAEVAAEKPSAVVLVSSRKLDERMREILKGRIPVYVGEENLKQVVGEGSATRIIARSEKKFRSGSFGPSTRFLVTEDPADAKGEGIFAMRPTLRAARILAGVKETRVSDPGFVEFHRFYRRFTGHEITAEDLASLVNGSDRLADLFAIPALFRVEWREALRLLGMASRLAAQSA